ncbi:MAG: response regulator [Egibacteraceae bacterium]
MMRSAPFNGSNRPGAVAYVRAGVLRDADQSGQPPKAARPISVFVCDEQPLVRAGLRTFLEREPDIEVAAEFDNGEKVMTAVRHLHPRVVLTDILLPGLNGIELAQRLGSLHSRQPVHVVVLLTSKDDEAVIRALKAGVRGLLIKTDPATDFIRAVRAVTAGEAMLAPSIAGRLLDRFADQLPVREAELPAILSRLTNRELEVLRLMAKGQSNAQIASMLSIHTTTVKSHVHHLLRKLAVRGRSQAVALAYETGFIRPNLA